MTETLVPKAAVLAAVTEAEQVSAWNNYGPHATAGKIREAIRAIPPTGQGDGERLRAAAKRLATYAEWQIADGHPYHPTLPSALSEFYAALNREGNNEG